MPISVERNYDLVTNPRLSVQLVVRNMDQWLPAALDSLRAQTCQDFEVIAVDDGSTDSTPQILQSVTDLPIRYVRTPGVGIAEGRNLAVMHAQAPVIATLDGDDIWLPWYVERMLMHLDRDPNAQIVSPELFMAYNGILSTERYYADGAPLCFFPENQLEACIRMNFVVPLTAFRREVFDVVGGYRTRAVTCSDWFFWIEAFAAGFRAIHEPLPCAVYNLRSGSQIASRTRLVTGRIAVLEHAKTVVPPGLASVIDEQLATQRMQLAIAIGKEAVLSGDRETVRTAFVKVARSKAASPRQRIGAGIAAALPRVARRVWETRATTATELRQERE